MARFMLDTNMCIYLIKNQPPQVAERFAQCLVGDVVMSAITYAELQHGVSMAANQEREGRNLARLIEDIPVVPFDADAGVAYGPIRKATASRNKDHLDKLIASHAIALGVVLVTNNERDFDSYPGLRVENWIKNAT